MNRTDPNLKRRYAWGNVKFKCRHNDEGLCPWVCAHAWQSLGIGRGVIVVCDHWADCGLSMKCLLAHEFSHVIGGDPTHGGITPKEDWREIAVGELGPW